jgi:glycosyltransferase involved in cell wall biosynthesis
MKKSRYSIIIPILNVEKYLTKCLESVKNQTFGDFECLLICDDSTDNSTNIAIKFAKEDKRFKLIKKSNTGLSVARNIGVQHSNGEYLLFLDGDDYFELNLLEILNNETSNNELVRFQVREVYNDHIIEWPEQSISGSGIQVFESLSKYHFVENAWSYCYNSKFYKQNKFSFKENCIAEDFGLIPLIISRAKTMKSISFIGYNYVQRNNSLMNNKDYNKKLKKMDDMILQSKILFGLLKENKKNNKLISFISNSLIYYSTTLNYKDYLKYKSELKIMNVFNNIEKNNFKRKIKWIIISISPYFFYNVLMRKK